MKNLKSYPQHELWKDGARQELIPEDGEILKDAVAFMHESLKQYGHDDLTFYENDIEFLDGKYYIILRKILPDAV